MRFVLKLSYKSTGLDVPDSCLNLNSTVGIGIQIEGAISTLSDDALVLDLVALDETLLVDESLKLPL